MPGSSAMPPRPTMQKGVRVTSTMRTGSQKPIDTPMRGGLLQKQTGEDGLPMSGWPSERIDAEPIVSGKRQLQQMSVIGFMKRPWQVGPAAAGPDSSASSHSAKVIRRAWSLRMALRQLVDAQPPAVLCDERGDLADAQPRRENALLVVVDGPAPPAHQLEVGAASEDRLDLAVARVDEPACLGDLVAIAGVEEEQGLAERHRVEW